jgi:hypothetical protein
MKAKLILINWALSFMGLCIDTEASPFWVVLLCFGWFAGSCFLLKYADKRGWMDKIVKRYKLDEV